MKLGGREKWWEEHKIHWRGMDGNLIKAHYMNV